MQTIKVVNIKCGGCERGIIDALNKKGLKNISVDVIKQEVSFDGDRSLAVVELEKIGYPEKNSILAKDFLKKAISYKTCMVGTMEEGIQSNEKRTLKFWAFISIPLVILVSIILFL